MSLKVERTSKFPFPKADPVRRRDNFEEVQLPYTLEEAMEEASRCVTCGNPVCMDVCPLQTDVRGMCEAVARGDLASAYHRVRETNPLLGTTARCCPQLDSLCEAACVIGTRGEPVASGMIQRFVADWERTVSRQPDPKSMPDTGKSVAVIGAGPRGSQPPSCSGGTATGSQSTRSSPSWGGPHGTGSPTTIFPRMSWSTKPIGSLPWG